ncbi:uncharacterized protein LOC125230715 [Leguminivora glycinivorella]|uniref:uncharacterized protein LOC125230715 n=1 Tax=Leguminivora glycinivorella TaxID=1035111 RepID=UPI00200EDE29|nr:uncharacterized protein LOC125230715 [Leguminivora glycinivorella]
MSYRDVYCFDDIQDAIDDFNEIQDDPFDDIQDAIDDFNEIQDDFDDIQDAIDDFNEIQDDPYDDYDFGLFDENLDDPADFWFDDVGDVPEDFSFDEIENALDEISGDRNRGAPSRGDVNLTFKPKYQQGQSGRDRAINAMIEIRSLWGYVSEEAKKNYTNMYSKLSVPLSDKLVLECQRNKEQYAVYDRISLKWLIESKQSKYVYCYDGEAFVEFNVAVKSVRPSNRFLLVGRYTFLRQELNLFARTRLAPSMFGAFSLPALKLIVGVPGCGKTTHIIKNHQPGSLVLTSCAEGAGDIRARMGALRNSRDSSQYRGAYRTIDSYLLHSRAKYGTVWMDEALMEHPGKLFLVCLFSQCHTMYLLGDPNQLGYINRVESVNLLYDKSSTFFKGTETLNISYRCPVDVMAVIADKYEGGVYSASEVTRSMKCQKFTGLECVPKTKDVKYLVFKQAEKQIMKEAKYNVSTIHEFQGKEAEHVAIVRMSRNLDEQLYKSAPHMQVGISRHRNSLVYYTPVTDDLKKLIETPLTPKDLNKIKKVVK